MPEPAKSGVAAGKVNRRLKLVLRRSVRCHHPAHFEVFPRYHPTPSRWL